MVQIASAIKSVHAANLAVRCMDPSKVIVTDKNRIRLNACSVLDVVQFETNRVLAELQQEDFLLFGKLMLQLATNNLSANPAVKGTVEHLTRTYCTDLVKDIVSEQLESEAFTNFRPLDISLVFRTLVDIAELAHETGNATIFKLSAEERYVVIIGV